MTTDTRSITVKTVLSSEYVHGSEGHKVALLMTDNRVYEGWGLHKDMSLADIIEHNYHVEIFKSQLDYIPS